MLADFWFFTIEKLPLKFCRAPPGGRHNIYYTSFEPARCDDSKYLWQFGQFHCFRTIYIILYDRIFSVRRPYISNIWGSYILSRQKSWLRTVYFQPGPYISRLIHGKYTIIRENIPTYIFSFSYVKVLSLRNVLFQIKDWRLFTEARLARILSQNRVLAVRIIWFYMIVY